MSDGELSPAILPLFSQPTGHESNPITDEQIADFFRNPKGPIAENISPRIRERIVSDGDKLIAKVVEEACMKAGCAKSYDKLRSNEQQAVIAAVKSYFLDKNPEPLDDAIAKKLTNKRLQVVPLTAIIEHIGAAINTKRGAQIG